jgi:hypothetical protein
MSCSRMLALTDEQQTELFQLQHPSSGEPQPYNVTEIRNQFLTHVREVARYWAELDLMRPDVAQAVSRDGEALYRTRGTAFSILAALDGCCTGLPGFLLVPYPHPDDKAYCILKGERWYPQVPELVANILCDIAGTLHESLHKEESAAYHLGKHGDKVEADLAGIPTLLAERHGDD